MQKENKPQRFKKSKKQVEILNEFYFKSQNWSQNTIRSIAEITNLPKEKVYKWYWDQKKKNQDDKQIDICVGEFSIIQNHLTSDTHQLYQCNGLQLNQEVSENLKSRLICLAKDLVLMR